MSVSRQNTSAMRGCARRKDRTASCGMNATLLATTVARLWSMTSRCRLCRSGMSPGMWNDMIWRLAGEPFEDRAALRRAVLVPDNVGVCLKIPHNDFFFQAEDGIRDIGVTGVQTCALPI